MQPKKEENKIYKNRKSIRLKNYDYSQKGMYYITICTKNRKETLGKIKRNVIDNTPAHSIQIKLSKIGKIVEQEIKNTQIIRNNVNIHNYVIMPNHIHMIIEIKNNVGVACHATQKEENTNKIEKSKMLIPKIIQQIKTITIKKTNKYIKMQGLHTMQPLQWQRNYYEHIIRNEKEYYRIYKYIEQNPLKYYLKKRNN